MTDQGVVTPDRLAITLRVFADVLGHEVSPDQNFFDAGGHSVMVIEVIARLRKQYGLAVPARQFLANASARAVAETATVDNANHITESTRA
jgi:acyl carrier protein